jgi:hypothetical protein
LNLADFRKYLDGAKAGFRDGRAVRVMFRLGEIEDLLAVAEIAARVESEQDVTALREALEKLETE